MLEQIKNFSRNQKIALIGVFAVGLCAFCGLLTTLLPSSEPEPAPEPEAITILITATPEETPLPTEPPPPTNTPEPTKTPKPTATPTEPPTPTPEPSPTPVPDPIILTGSGDSVVDFENLFNASIAHIRGNAARDNFAVWNYGNDGSRLDLLVNTIDPYDGVVLLDLGETRTTRFEVTAVGDWEIVVDFIMSTRILDIPGTIEGTGDDVIVLDGPPRDLAHIKGNEAEDNFAIWGYGSSSDLLVNTIDPYEGTVVLAEDTILLVITAVGPWSIEVTGK